MTISSQQVFKRPTAYDLAAGAALPVACFTAQLAVFEMTRVRRGDRVLIECATSGVGVIAIQMARHAGTEVTGLTISPHKESLITELGATAYTLDEFRADPELAGYDFLLNASTGIFALNSLHVLRDPAWVAGSRDRCRRSSRSASSPHIGKVFPAAEVAAAHAFLETKQATGKVLLQW